MSSNKLSPMSDDELLGIVESYVSNGIDFQQTKLAGQITKSIKYYYGEKLGNEVQGRSSVVSKDVADAVDWIMPSLMRVFHGGKDVVQFIPETKDDIKLARQAHDYVNYLYNVENDGFTNTYSVIQDALLAKNGIMKHWYEDRISVEFDNFTGLTKDQVELLLLEDDVELMASTPDETGMYFDVEVSKKKYCKTLRVEPVPPEEFIIDTWSSCIEDASFVGHHRLVSRSELVELGHDPELVYNMSSESTQVLRNGNSNSITRARNSIDDAQFTNSGFASGAIDDSQQLIEVTEGIIKVDYDGDGIAERRRVFVADGVLLSNERYDEPLFTDFRVHIMAHKFYGLSMFDMLQDIQKIKTTLLRNLLDNMYTLNNGRYEVVDGQVNMDDLLYNQLGGVVRTKMAGAIKQLDTPPLPVQNFTMLDYLDTLKDNRTGISKTTKGMDSGILHSNQAGSAVADVMSAAEQKQELIARVLANSFCKLFRNIYKLTLIHQDREVVFQVRGEFTSTNPSHWRKDYRITPVAGIGNGKVAEKVMASQMILNIMTSLQQAGAENILFNWNTTYDMLLELTQAAGFEEAHRFWLNPDTPSGLAAIQALEQRKAQPSPEMIKTQAEIKEKEQRLMLDAETAKAKREIEMLELKVREREAAVKERELDLESQKIDIKKYEADLRYAATIAELQLETQQGRAVAIGDNQVPNVRDGRLPKG